MLCLSAFYGIVIGMYFSDHPPPHFHARYGEYETQIEIATGTVLRGQLPRRAADAPARRNYTLNCEESSALVIRARCRPEQAATDDAELGERVPRPTLWRRPRLR